MKKIVVFGLFTVCVDLRIKHIKLCSKLELWCDGIRISHCAVLYIKPIQSLSERVCVLQPVPASSRGCPGGTGVLQKSGGGSEEA